MGNQDRPRPDVERLEPRLTLSTLRPVRDRAAVAIVHAAHSEVAPADESATEAPMQARSIESEPEAQPDRITLPPETSWPLRAYGGFQTPSSDEGSGHDGSGPHTESTAQTGQIAFVSDHDPTHFVLVSTYVGGVVPSPSPVSSMTHDGPGMTMGSDMPSRVAVTMPMDHRPGAMPRMTPTRESSPVPMHLEHEPVTAEAVDPGGESHGHGLEPGLDPELSPGAEPDITPSLTPPEMPMADLDLSEAVELPRAPRVEVSSARTGSVGDDVDTEHEGPRLAALSAVAAFFHRNLVFGRVAPKDALTGRADGVRSLMMCVRSWLVRLRQAFRRGLP